MPPNLLVLEIESGGFNDSCWQYLENMVHLRKLQLSSNRIVGVSRSLQQTLMQQLSKLQELSLSGCYIGGHRAIAGALYSTHRSRLSVLNLSHCHLVDDDLNGIDALKNTLEVLDLSGNWGLSKEGLTHCTDLVNLKKLRLCNCGGINDLSPLEDCLNLEDLLSYDSLRLTDASFQVFSEEPNSFPNLRMLCVSSNTHQLTEKIFEHLAKNNHLVHQLKELYVGDMGKILSSSATARENLCQLRGLRRLEGIGYGLSESDRKKLKGELMGSLKNLEVG